MTPRVAVTQGGARGVGGLTCGLELELQFSNRIDIKIKPEETNRAWIKKCTKHLMRPQCCLQDLNKWQSVVWMKYPMDILECSSSVLPICHLPLPLLSIYQWTWHLLYNYVSLGRLLRQALANNSPHFLSGTSVQLIATSQKVRSAENTYLWGGSCIILVKCLQNDGDSSVEKFKDVLEAILDIDSMWQMKWTMSELARSVQEHH